MKKYVIVIIGLIILSSQLFGASEMATFESFYVESSTIGWIVAGVFAIGAALAIFFTGGTASPIVISIGTYIGSLSGLSGIAATNSGLALIGGGSIAAGGLGIAGGTALLTAALTFSTEVVIDFTVSKGINTYNQVKMIEESKNLRTLPIPLNTSGSDEYERIITKLKKEINQEELISSKHNQEILINILNNNKLDDNDLKDLTLKSYMYFVTYKYNDVKKYSQKAIELARIKELRRTLPAYMFAVSSIYDETVSFEEINKNYFSYSVLAERDNELIPLMFSIYFQNIMFKLNSTETFNYKIFDNIKNIAYEIKNDNIKKKVFMIIITKYFEQIKLEQQKILSLTKSDNESIKYSPETLESITKSLNQYSNLVLSLKEIINDKFIKQELDKKEELKEINIIFVKYEENQKYLELLIKNFENEQNSIFMKVKNFFLK